MAAATTWPSRSEFIDMLHVEVGIDLDESTGLYGKSIWIAPNHVTRIEPLTGEDAVRSTGGKG